MNRKKNSRKRKWAVAGLAAVSVTAILCLLGKDKGEPVTVGRPVRGDIVEVIPANGRIRPVTEVVISPDISGEIVLLTVKEGDHVGKGDLILRIKEDIYRSLRDRAEAALNAAKAQLRLQEAAFAKAEQEYLRNERLFGQEVISLQEYQTSRAEYLSAGEQMNAAGYNVESAAASLKEADENLAKTAIYSPIDGIVSSLNIEKGERVVGTSQMAGTEMLRIADFDVMEVVVDINENDIMRISHGDTASIEVDAYPGRTFTGVVTRIASSARNISGGIAAAADVTGFDVRVRILPESYRDIAETASIPFRPGMSASVEIVTDQRYGVLVIPLQSVTSDERVFLYDEATSTAKSVKISTGIQDLQNIEVTGGLSDSSPVITGPYGTVSKILEDGMKISAIFADNT
ncbi:MAG TPA: efflux RND transporter periplasmic adaptor subunit [Candidatus Coprenecus pullistercoris]|nr:efflux RND transporter periplasmic adaptor subunit [Candidatus Coprenecus pullistercoris]